MAIVTVSGFPSFLGMLYQIGMRPNSMLRLAGRTMGQSIGEPVDWLISNSYEHPVSVNWTLAAPSQPAVLEGVAPGTPHSVALTQDINVCQIYQEAVEETYLKLADFRVSGSVPIPQGPANMPAQDGRDYAVQVMATLAKIAQDYNFTSLNGVYANPANPAVSPLRTRGIITAVTSNRNDQTAATGVDAAKYRTFVEDTLQALVDDNGYSVDQDLACFCGVTEYRNIAAAYSAKSTNFVSPEETVVGISVRRIATNLGTITLVMEPDVPSARLLFAKLSAIRPVANPVPGKGVLFIETLGKVGSSMREQIYGHLGINYGNEKMHGLLMLPANVAIAS